MSLYLFVRAIKNSAIEMKILNYIIKMESPRRIALLLTGRKPVVLLLDDGDLILYKWRTRWDMLPLPPRRQRGESSTSSSGPKQNFIQKKPPENF